MADTTLSMLGHALLMRHLCVTLMSKGALTAEEASAVFVEAAREVREGTEDAGSPRSDLGEMQAHVYEQQASWLLGHKGLL